MSIKNNVTTPELEAIRNLNALMESGNHNFGALAGDEEPEKLELKQIKIPKEDLLLFQAPMSQTDMVQTSELQNGLLDIFQQIFADVFSVKFTYDTQRGFIFTVAFRYLTDEQYKMKNEDSEGGLIRCISSSIEPDEAAAKNSIAANFMMMVQQQQVNSYDASKYAKISKEAKELLTDLLFFSPNNNKKKRWVNGENYTLANQTGTGFGGGRTFTNIIGTVFLDAEKVLALISQTSDEANKFEYSIVPVSNNITNTDSLVEIKKTSKQRKNQIRNKYGVQFSK